MTPKQKEYKPIFDEYQRLKALHPFENKTELIKLMIGEHASKRDIAKYDDVLRRHFDISGNRYTIQAEMEEQIFMLWKQYKNEYHENTRQTAKRIADSMNLDLRRVLNALYRNGFFGNCAKKRVEERKKTGKKPQEHKVENDKNAWSGLFKDNIMRFSPAWFGKNIQAV